MPDKSFYESLPAKRMGAGALFFDAEGRVLLVDTTYKEFWEIPGGAVEKDESPLAACARELKEELGYDRPVGRLLCVDYNAPSAERTESLMFIFYGGRLTSAETDAFALDPGELKGWKFVDAAELSSYLPPMLADRVAQCVKIADGGQTLYLEDQQIPQGL